MQEQPHGVPGQLNIYVLDRDSPKTRYGQHNRIIVCKDNQAGEIILREDDIGLPWSTHTDRMWVANHDSQRLHGKHTKLVLRLSEQSDDGRQRWHYYTIVPTWKKQTQH